MTAVFIGSYISPTADVIYYLRGLAMLKTTLEFDESSDDGEVYDQIADILNRRMPIALRERAWITFVVNQLSSNSCCDSNPSSEHDIDDTAIGHNWEQAYEILCKHVDNAVAEIKQTFGA
jgi:hypothetical protein